MKINKDELIRMINQIDDDLLYEAAEEYHIPNFSGWKRVIPVAACIALLVLGAAVSVLRNITINMGHEGIEGTVISENEGDTEKEDTLNDSEKSYVIQMDSEETTLHSILDSITASFEEKGISEKLVIDSMEVRLLPKDNTVLNGRIGLVDMESLTNVTISISKSKIIIDMEESSTWKEEEQTVVDSSEEGEISRVNFYDFCKAADYVPELTKEFSDSEYMLVSADLVTSISDINVVSEDTSVLIYDGELTVVENREDFKDMTSYSYAFYIRTSVVPEIASRDVLVYIK